MAEVALVEVDLLVPVNVLIILVSQAVGRCYATSWTLGRSFSVTPGAWFSLGSVVRAALLGAAEAGQRMGAAEVGQRLEEGGC